MDKVRLTCGYGNPVLHGSTFVYLLCDLKLDFGQNMLVYFSQEVSTHFDSIFCLRKLHDHELLIRTQVWIVELCDTTLAIEQELGPRVALISWLCLVAPFVVCHFVWRSTEIVVLRSICDAARGLQEGSTISWPQCDNFDVFGTSILVGMICDTW